jgi:hypothetical protein
MTMEVARERLPTRAWQRLEHELRSAGSLQVRQRTLDEFSHTLSEGLHPADASLLAYHWANLDYEGRRGDARSGVEIESPTKDSLLRAMTTDAATIAGLHGRAGGRPVPTVEAEAVAAGAPLDTLHWEELSAQAEHELLAAACADDQFSRSRTIEGVHFLPVVEGPEGPVDLSDILEPQVEHRTAESVDGVRGLEVHFNAEGASSDVMAKAFEAAEVMGITSKRAHVHAGVDLLPEGVRDSEPQSVFLFLDFYRRINILAELIEVAEGRVLKSGRNFGYMSDRNLEFAADDLDDFFNGQEFHDRHPLVALALRLGIYDDPSLGGLEVRTARRERGVLVDLAQRGIMTGNYGPRTDLATAWFEEHRESDAVGALAGRLHYNRWEPDFPIDEETQRALRANHLGAFMFLHDWSKDWVFREDPEALDKVTTVTKKYRDALLGALREESLSRRGLTQMVRDYVWESGLLEVFVRSFGRTVEEMDIQEPKEGIAQTKLESSGDSWFLNRSPLDGLPQFDWRSAQATRFVRNVRPLQD